MKRVLIKLMMCIVFVILSSSCDTKHNDNIIYSGQLWDVILVNDSIIIVVSGFNGDDKAKPIIFNIKQLKSWNEN